MALGVSERVIQKHASELGLTVNGKQTELDERAVTIIKAKIERSGRTDLAYVCELPKITTDLEMMALDMKVSAWRQSCISRQENYCIITHSVKEWRSNQRQRLHKVSVSTYNSRGLIYPRNDLLHSERLPARVYEAFFIFWEGNCDKYKWS